MKEIFSLLFICANLGTIAQIGTSASRPLLKTEISNKFPDSISKRLNISYPIWKTFSCTDKTGTYYLVLSQKFLQFNENHDSLFAAIKGVVAKETPGGLIKQAEVSDALANNPKKYVSDVTISFWTKYLQLTDADADGLLDPVIVYGTMGQNGFDDGRIVFLILYKGQKILIRHQNGISDYERNLQIDKAFYTLPQKLQTQVQATMTRMVENNHAIFPAGYQKGMVKKALLIDENKNSYY